MGNTRAKGRRYELKTKEMLEAEGWMVELVKGGTGWQKSTDFFGMFDIIALHPERDYLLCIQCKAGKRWYTPSKGERALLGAFMASRTHVRKQWWMWKDRVKEPRIIEL